MSIASCPTFLEVHLALQSIRAHVIALSPLCAVSCRSDWRSRGRAQEGRTVTEWTVMSTGWRSDSLLWHDAAPKYRFRHHSDGGARRNSEIYSRAQASSRSDEVKAIRVIIIGGGFAAIQFAKTLRGKLGLSECEILLFNRENHMVFHPLLADVAGASINPDAAAAPLRQMLPGVECRTERVQRIDLRSSEIEFDDGSGALTRLHYDHVAIACGAESNLGIIPGMSEHAFAFKVMRDAIDLRQHVVHQMEYAEATTDPDLRRWHLSFIIVGAGFSGVEVAGEINELVRSSTRFYRNFRKEDVVVSLVHSQDQILPEV